MASLTRRNFINRLIALAAVGRLNSGNSPAASPSDEATWPAIVRARIVDIVQPQRSAERTSGPEGPVHIDEFNIVGQYDLDWLTEPLLDRVFDNLAASPSAFGGVRFFHSLDSGTLANSIDDDPLDGGTVWSTAGSQPDFSRTFRALEVLTQRGLTPFIVLNFFPKAVSGHAATPPVSFDTWKSLIRQFLDELVADPRFGAAKISTWHFEVWNEPNGQPFWRGSYNPQYFDLYRATSEAVLASGHAIRLGGPAIFYTPDSQKDMENFLRFLSAEPLVKCDFISLHAKGSWSTDREPDLSNAVTAVAETADLALAIDKNRFSGLPIINDEADMRVGFDVPYLARMDERFAAWMCSLFIAYDGLNSRYASEGLRFSAASDNANQQLVQTSFDGRRALFTRASTSARDLLKLPVFNFYEILRLLGDQHGAMVVGTEAVYPNSELFHIITTASSHVCSVFSIHPRTSAEPPRARTIDYSLAGIPWQRVNIARFRIDASYSNAYAAAGGAEHSVPFPSSAEVKRIRRAQELSVSAPIENGLFLEGGEIRERVVIDPYAVLAYWITPFIPDQPAEPIWREIRLEDGNVILRWRPNAEPFFYSYEVYLVLPGLPLELLTPLPQRSAMWVDTAPPPGTRSYAVRAVTASGMSSSLVQSAAVSI